MKCDLCKADTHNVWIKKICWECRTMGKKIEIKDVDVLKSLLNHKIDYMLLNIILWVAENYGLCFTEGFRTAKHKHDLHGLSPLRAVDIRSWFYRPEVAEKIEKAINERWIYDLTRPDKQVAWIHNSGQGIHFHIQVHPNTKWR